MSDFLKNAEHAYRVTYDREYNDCRDQGMDHEEACEFAREAANDAYYVAFNGRAASA